jgi:hypothetical protein
VTSRLTTHRHKKGDADPKFAARLDIIRMPFDVVLDANAVLGKVRQAFDTEAQNETKRASKLMANMYTAVEKAYPAGNRRQGPRPRDLGDPCPDPVPDVRRRHRDVADREPLRNVILDDTLPRRLQHRPGATTCSPTSTPASPGHGSDRLRRVQVRQRRHLQERIDLRLSIKDFRAAILDACDRGLEDHQPSHLRLHVPIRARRRDPPRPRRALHLRREHPQDPQPALPRRATRRVHTQALGREPREEGQLAQQLWDRLGRIRYMDPACGCGNFIIVAYRELRAPRAPGHGGASTTCETSTSCSLDANVGPQGHPRPLLRHRDRRVAGTDRRDRHVHDRPTVRPQAQERFGHAPERLPIQEQAKIVVGNALRLDWEQVMPPVGELIVAGNPPFLGHATRSDAQGQEFARVWGKDDISRLDYVTGWHAKSLGYLAHSNDARFAFVSTNSITQGDRSHTSSSRSLLKGGVSDSLTPLFLGSPRQRVRPRSTASLSASTARRGRTLRCTRAVPSPGVGPCVWMRSMPTLSPLLPCS